MKRAAYSASQIDKATYAFLPDSRLTLHQSSKVDPIGITVGIDSKFATQFSWYTVINVIVLPNWKIRNTIDIVTIS